MSTKYPVSGIMIAEDTQVTRQAPAHLVRRRAEITLHVGQRHVDDRRVEHLDQRGRHHGERDPQAIDGILLFGHCRRSAAFGHCDGDAAVHTLEQRLLR
jgi:hypothetical protein